MIKTWIVTLGAKGGGGPSKRRRRAAVHRASSGDENSSLQTSGPGESDEGMPLRMPAQQLAADSNCYRAKLTRMAEEVADRLESGAALRDRF